MANEVSSKTVVVCPSCRTPIERKIHASSGVYQFQCVCGAENAPANPVGKCWDCGREFRLDWDGKMER